MTPIFRAYLGVALGLMLVFAGLLAAFNRFMDPFDYYWSPIVPGINAVKVKARRYERYVKPDILQRLQPATVILGNSIAEIGFDPEGPALRERRAYNDGLLGAQWPLIQCHALYALALPATRHIVLGLKLEAMPAVDCGRPENAVQHASLRQRLFSTEALSAGVTTLLNQDRPSMRKHTGLILGWRGKPGPDRRFRPGLKQAGCEDDMSPAPAADDFSGLAAILHSARQRGVRVDLFFYPHHAYFLETQLACPDVTLGAQASRLHCGQDGRDPRLRAGCPRSQGDERLHPGQRHASSLSDSATRRRWALMENVAQLVAGMHHDELFALWSFYEYNAYTTERVTAAPMQYWQDLTHFNWEYGEAVLEQMFAPAATPAIGVRLTPATMEEAKRRFAAGRAQSHQEHPELYEDLQRMLAQRSAR